MVLLLLLALAAAPWTHPLAFQPATGWTTGKSGNTRSVYVGRGRWAKEPLESSAWTSRDVPYRDPATADPPNRTLAALPPHGIVVWAVISKDAGEREQPIRLDIALARRYACCDAVGIAAEYELTGSGPRHVYSVIVRIYFGSKPNRAALREAQLALRRLDLPAAA